MPPGRFGDVTIATVGKRVTGLLSVLSTELDGLPYEPSTIAVRLDLAASLGTIIEGNVQGVCGDTVVAISPSRLKPVSILTALIDLAALTLHDPNRAWSLLAIGRESEGDSIAARRISMLDPTCALDALTVFHDLRLRALTDAIPAFAATTQAVFAGDLTAAAKAWSPAYDSGGKGERGDRWISFIPEFDVEFTDLAALPARLNEPDAAEPASGNSDPTDRNATDGGIERSPGTRLDFWAERLWGTVARLAAVEELSVEQLSVDATDAAASDSDGSADD